MTVKTQQIHLIGAGCASLSLQHYLRHTGIDCTFYGQKSPAFDRPHFWGFWEFDWLADAAQHSTAQWTEWQFANREKIICQSSSTHPYHALNSTDWLTFCSANSPPCPAMMTELKNDGLVLDSRPPSAPENCLVQHFIGQIIQTSLPCFNPKKAMLMDFRCDQSHGIHFIYMLPFSEDTALVESTFFSPALHEDTVYLDAISTYMNEIIGQPEYDVLHQEKGQIPMAQLEKHDKNFLGIGTNGGALRASSGYAFSFIQKQVQDLAHKLRNGQTIHQQNDIKHPIRFIDRWMDGIFLRVISAHPQIAPQLFMQLAEKLSGDEFAAFMSGQAGFKIYAKIIAAMPKRLFVHHMLAAIKEGK